MVIYVITQGSYSDYHICDVTIDKARAEKLQKFYTNSYDEAVIEEYDTDQSEVSNDKLDRLIPVYQVYISEEGRYSVSIKEYHDSIEPYNARFEVEKNRAGIKSLSFVAVLTAMDEKHALKIALDQRAKMLAQRFGL